MILIAKRTPARKAEAIQVGPKEKRDIPHPPLNWPSATPRHMHAPFMDRIVARTDSGAKRLRRSAVIGENME